jgi:hypothetical protein
VVGKPAGLRQGSGSAGLEFKALESGSYLLAVSSQLIGDYQVWLEDAGFDAHGDSRAEATRAQPVDSPFILRQEARWDLDVLTFDAPAGVTSTLRCRTEPDFHGGGADLELQDAQGTRLDPVYITDGEGQLQLRPAAAQRAYVRFGHIEWPHAVGCWLEQDPGEAGAVGAAGERGQTPSLGRAPGDSP